MSQGPLCPNLSKKVQKEVSQMTNCNLSRAMLLGGLRVNLNQLIIKPVAITPIPILSCTPTQNLIVKPKDCIYIPWQPW